MTMTKKQYLNLLVNEFHSATMATIGADGHPVTRIIDLMLWDESGVYFLTAKGKSLYTQLMEQKFIALSATAEKRAISLRGKIKNIHSEKLEEIFERNPYMKGIYPGDTKIGACTADNAKKSAQNKLLKRGISMTKKERLIILIKTLLKESPEYHNTSIPKDPAEQRMLLRALMNVRAPKPIDENFIQVQNEYLQEVIEEKGVTDLHDLTPVKDNLYVWQGDITTLRCDAIVNAANSQMTGCYIPGHACIDNCIHTYAGVQLRYDCFQKIQKQDFEEPTGQAKITPAYNLPCRYVLHTVGPIINGHLTKKDCDLLASCYTSCLQLATDYHLESVAFCCISTGVFHFPNEKAAEIAIASTTDFLKQNDTTVKKVVFNVFKENDKEIYERLLGSN